MFLEIVGLFIAFLLLWFALDYDFSSHRIPGPLRFPIVGTLIQHRLESSSPHLALHNLSKKYGDVMRVRFGFVDAVIASSYETTKEIFSRDESNGRILDSFVLERNRNKNLGIVFGEGQLWHQSRVFSKKALKEYGFGKRASMEHLILDEVNTLIEDWKGKIESGQIGDNGLEMKFENNFALPLLNLLLALIKGERYSHSDKDFIQLAVGIKKMAVAGSSFGTGLLTSFPFLSRWFPERTGFNILLTELNNLRNYFDKVLDSRRENGCYLDNPECFTDIFLKNMEENPDSELFNQDQFQVICQDLIVAGTGTTSSFILTAIKLLTCNPDIQTKIHDEILKIQDETGKPLSLSDMERMIYVQAVMLEVHRHAKIVVNSVPRRATKDFQYKNYLIKKDTMLLWNLHSIFLEKSFWGDPENFRPERFLDEKSEIIKSKAEVIIPFGVGKRICFGDFFARDNYFMFLVTLIRWFTFELPPGVHTLDCEPALGLTLYPKPFAAVVKCRTPT